MERQSLVQDVEVIHEGQTYRASYFVEGSTIHAQIGGRNFLSPLGTVPAADTVRALLTGHLLQQTRKTTNAQMERHLMAFSYRAVDLRTHVVDAVDIVIDGMVSPEEAARKALDIDVVRSDARKDLVARVYWQPMGQPTTMVRLYRKVEGRR